MPATADATLRDRLKAVRASLEETRDARAEKVKERQAAKEAFAGADLKDVDVLQSAEFKAAEKAVEGLGELDDRIADLTATERGIAAMMGEPSSAAASPRPGIDPREIGQHLAGWDADTLLAGDQYRSFIEAGGPTSRSKFGAVNLGLLASREDSARFLAAEVGSDNKQGAIPADRRGIVAPLLKPLSLLDLIPTGTTDSNVVEYVQVVTIPSSAAETAEGGLKPEQSFTTIDADAPVRTIAGWIKVRKQALADVAGLRTMLGQLLPYDVRRRIESQILVGDGAGQNLTGIYNTDGIGAPAWVHGDNPADAILRAITVIVLGDGDPNFVALNPITWQNLLLMRWNQTDRTGDYLYGSPGTLQAPTLWGLALTKNRVVPERDPLVGDANGATVLVREGVQVLVSDSDGDDFTHNRATILAEARVAFPVWRPGSFAVATTRDPAGS